MFTNKRFGHIILNYSKTVRARYFGTNLKWEVNAEEGMRLVKQSRRPGMVVVHKSWCAACRGLKPKFSASKDIQQLSKGFVLISLSEDDEPTPRKFAPDGNYVPRILFVSPQGVVMTEVMNLGGDPEVRYFYNNVRDIQDSMRRVLRLFTNQ